MFHTIISLSTIHILENYLRSDKKTVSKHEVSFNKICIKNDKDNRKA